MKKIVSLLLAVALVMGLGITVFAAGSPTSDGNKGAGGTATTNVPRTAANTGMGIYDADGNKIATVPANKIKKISVGNANKLSDEDKEAFLAAYEEAKKVEGKKVKYFFWLDIPEKYKNADDFGYFGYKFTCTGKNVQVTVNGKDMEVEKVGKNTYIAHLTEFGAVAILCD